MTTQDGKREVSSIADPQQAYPIDAQSRPKFLHVVGALDRVVCRQVDAEPTPVLHTQRRPLQYGLQEGLPCEGLLERIDPRVLTCEVWDRAARATLSEGDDVSCLPQRHEKWKAVAPGGVDPRPARSTCQVDDGRARLG